jgi:hypothetical protein
MDAASRAGYAAFPLGIIQGSMHHYTEITPFQAVIVCLMLGMLVSAFGAIVISLWRLHRE